MRTRMTKVDWEIINEALALLEAHIEDDADLYGRHGLRRVESCRRKVWERERR